MEDLNIRIQEILSHGHFVKGEYYLVCNGIMQGKQRVKIRTYFSFYHALQCASQQDSNQSSIIKITPLREWTTIKIQAFIEEKSIDFNMYIDLKKNCISLEVLQDPIETITNTNVAKIISCFGIKQGNKVLYLMDLYRIKTIIKNIPRIFD